MRTPEGASTSTAAWASDLERTEGETRDALHRLEPLRDELFPAEQARIVRLLVEGVSGVPHGG